MEKIGIDIGGTTIKAGLIEKNEIKILFKVKTPKKKREIINKLYFICDNLITKKTKFIGLGIPGTINNKGLTNKLKNIDFANVNLKKLFENRYKIKVNVNNDANCFALAEAIYGKGKDFDNVLGITLGTGLGTGLVINKKIYSGRGAALEYGSNIINIQSLSSVEDFLGKKAIIKSAKEYNLNIKEPKDLYNLALKKDKNAIKFWNEYGSILGLMLSNLVKTFDPDIIIIGGNISDAWKFFSKDMKKALNKHTNLKPCPVYKSEIEETGVIGASLLSL